MKIWLVDLIGSWPREVQIGVAFVVGSWIVFVITAPMILRVIRRRWENRDAVECRRKQKSLWKVLFWVHAVVLMFVFFGIDYIQNHIELYGKYLDKYLPYYFVVVSFCIFLQIDYEAVRGYVIGRFGHPPQNSKWKWVVNEFKSVKKNIKTSAFYCLCLLKFKEAKRFIYLFYRKISAS